MAYDPMTGHVLMFGGDTGAFPSPASNQTWSYDGSTWTQLNPLTSPTGKLGIQLVFDSNRGVFVMYGSSNTSAFGGASVNQTWEFDGTTWTQVFPYVDRSNYVSPMLNNVGFALACEKLLGITVPERCQWYRMALGELARMSDHLTCYGAMAMELGAFTPFLWLIKSREWIWELLEKVSGARLTHSYVRVGGVSKDLPDGFAAELTYTLDETEKVLRECVDLLNQNKIFRDRMAGIGAMSKEDAIATGCVGPIARACGVDYDVRKDYPYSIYPEVEFDVPVGTTGDCFDRYLVRLEEVNQSIRILRQCLKQIPDGPVMVDDPRCVAMMEDFIAAHPDLWIEDIGED